MYAGLLCPTNSLGHFPNKKITIQHKNSGTASFSLLLGYYLDYFYSFVYLFIPMSPKYVPAVSCLHHFKLTFNCRTLYVTQRCSTLTEWPTVSPVVDLLCACKFKLSIIRKLCSKFDSNGVVPASVCRVYVLIFFKKLWLTLFSQIIFFQCLIFLSIYLCTNALQDPVPYSFLSHRRTA